MKSSRFAALLLVFSAGANADLAWKGTIGGAHPRFALTDTSTGASKWVSVGGNFASYVVSQYDEQRQVLILQHGGSQIELSLAATEYRPPAPVEDPLSLLSGFRLANELATRGDVELKARLAQQRAAVLRQQELTRQLVAAERAVKSNAATAPTPVTIKSLQSDVLRMNQEISRMNSEIERVANEHRQKLAGGS